MNVATRLRPETGTRAGRTSPPPSEVRDNILCEEIFQPSHVSLLGGTDKGIQKAPLLARTDGCTSAICDMFAGTGDELADVCFLHLQDVRDLVVGVIECFAQNICGAFCRREFLKEQKDRKLQCFTALRTYSGIDAGVHRFGKPRPDVGFAARVGGLDRLIHNRVVVVARYAGGFSTTLRFVDCHRNQTSCTISSASATLPSMR